MLTNGHRLGIKDTNDTVSIFLILLQTHGNGVMSWHRSALFGRVATELRTSFPSPKGRADCFLY